MLSSWIKRSREASSVTAQHRVADREKVVYASRDRQRDVQFIGHFSSGSRHAAEAQQVCGEIYSGTRSQLQPIQQGSQRLLGSSAAATATAESNTKSDRQRQQQQQPEQEQRPAPSISPVARSETHYQDDDRWARRGGGNSRHARVTEDDDGDDLVADNREIRPSDSISSVGCHEAQAQAQGHAQAHGARNGGSGRGGGGTGTGFRQQSEAQTTYYMHSNERQLFVSAPSWSPEAKVFDDVAAKANIAREQQKRLDSRWD